MRFGSWLFCVAALLIFVSSPAEAKHRHHNHHAHHRAIHHIRYDDRSAVRAEYIICDDRYGCRERVRVERAMRISKRLVHQGVARYEGERVVSHPSGCPHTAFCGCGTSVHIFGRPIRDLYLAANWRRFPPARPGPGMVAWRWGHVFAIIRSNGDGTVLAYDPNSGRHLTRIHNVSLRGFHVVDPHGNRVASR